MLQYLCFYSLMQACPTRNTWTWVPADAYMHTDLRTEGCKSGKQANTIELTVSLLLLSVVLAYTDCQPCSGVDTVTDALRRNQLSMPVIICQNKQCTC